MIEITLHCASALTLWKFGAYLIKIADFKFLGSQYQSVSSHNKLIHYVKFKTNKYVTYTSSFLQLR